jgi:thiol-disulfide isomerase/thioredoxin
VLVDVWASWCAPCREALPALAKMARELREQGIQVWLINIDGDHAKATAFLDQVLADRESVHLFFDPAGVSTSALGAPGMPTLYVIEAATVRRIEVGYSEDRIKALKADISPREAP